ncbi:MAG: hypothetical protein D6692_03865 [Planctomycetota bacterium]|nr:MAG: hypothetical protein D6692_03865 [Planctomycetota bacterium]
MLTPAVMAVCLCGVPDAQASSTALAARGIERAVETMERATLRADSGAYMAVIDTTDPVFAEEQRKWARDLRTRPVDSVDFRVDLNRLSKTPDGHWRAPLTVVWSLPGDDKPYSITYPALFRPLGLPEGAWLYAGRAWEDFPADGVRILLDPEDDSAHEIAEHLAARVAGFRAAIEEDLGETLHAEPTIKLYPDMASLQASIALSYTDPLGGWNEPGESIKILSRPGFVGPRLDATVAHELGHAVSFQWGEAIIEAPWWSLEGIAEVAADPFRESPEAASRDAARRMARDGTLMDFDRLADFRGEAMNHGRHVYVQGRSMVRYITERFGREKRNEWFRAMGKGRSLNDATRSVLGLPFERLNEDWRASLSEGE